VRTLVENKVAHFFWCICVFHAVLIVKISEFGTIFTQLFDVCRLLDGTTEPLIHEGNQCHCWSILPDKYRQVQATQAECYADIPDILHAADLCYDYIVRKILTRFLALYGISSYLVAEY